MYCKYCGSQIDDDSVFCTKCGKPVNQENTQPVIEPKEDTYESIIEEMSESDDDIEFDIEEENDGFNYKRVLIIIGIIVVAMIVIGCAGHFIFKGPKVEEEKIVEVEEETIDQQDKEEKKEEPEQKEDTKDDPSIVVSQPSSFNGNDFWIPAYTSSNPNEDSAMLVKAFFEMKGYNYSTSTLVSELGCANSRTNASTMAYVLCKHINENGIQAIYEDTYFSSASDFINNAGSVFSIVQTNVNDGYPTFFEVDPAYIYGGIPGDEYRFILVKGYELGDGGIVKLLIDDPIQGGGKIVGYDSFVEAVSNKSNIVYIH